MKNIKLLLLDDDSEVRKNLQMYFEDEGFTCFAFDNPVSALAFLKIDNVDVGIVDLRLPSMNGEEFIIEANKINKKMKYIIYTGSADYYVTDKLNQLGMNQEYVCKKPIQSMNIFVNKIETLLKT